MPNNMIEAARTTLVQARGLDKLDRPVILTPFKVITLDTGQHLSMLWGSTKLSLSYLSRLLPRTSNKLPRRRTISFDTGQPLSPVSWLKAWRAYVLSRVHKVHMASYMALRYTR